MYSKDPIRFMKMATLIQITCGRALIAYTNVHLSWQSSAGQHFVQCFPARHASISARFSGRLVHACNHAMNVPRASANTHDTEPVFSYQVL